MVSGSKVKTGSKKILWINILKESWKMVISRWKYYQKMILFESHTIGFHAQTQKLEPLSELFTEREQGLKLIEV